VKDPVVTPAHRRRPPRRSRSLEERLSVRFPGLFQRVAARIARLRPESRLKRALYVRSVHSGWDAFNRRDFELMLVRYAPDVEFQFTPGQQTLGLDGTFHGHAGVLAGLAELAEIWDRTTAVPAYVIDRGDRALFLGFMKTHAGGSGIELEQRFAQLITLRDGLVSHDESYFDWDEGMRAAGLDPQAVALPARPMTPV
jgi:ketosteroid isomerase-like protein